jgi:precorrin-6Y C5,15-methyltransferase (decarboxylating)
VSGARIAVVGIGADGWAGLGEAARQAVLKADEVFGAQRQLDLLPPLEAPKRPWPSPMEPLLHDVAARTGGTVCVVATGDPMLHGVGAVLARRVDPERLEVYPHPSAFAYACARLRWAAAGVELVSAVAHPVETVARVLQPGRRLVVYVTGADGAARLAALLRERGFGPSRFTVLEQLGGPGERITASTAERWGEQTADPLHVAAVECIATTGALRLPRVPGLPDEAFESDGQLTKRQQRAITLAALAPCPGELLWDVGAGSGSIAIEWLRAEPTARAIAVESRADRAERIAANALRLGVPELDVRHGEAPEALTELPPPDAVFIGGGLTASGLLDRCLAALRPGGRLVANAVTLQSDAVLFAAHAEHGGTLTRIEISHAEPIGGFSGWRAQRPVTQWAVNKDGG